MLLIRGLRKQGFIKKSVFNLLKQIYCLETDKYSRKFFHLKVIFKFSFSSNAIISTPRQQQRQGERKGATAALYKQPTGHTKGHGVVSVRLNARGTRTQTHNCHNKTNKSLRSRSPSRPHVSQQWGALLRDADAFSAQERAFAEKQGKLLNKCPARKPDLQTAINPAQGTPGFLLFAISAYTYSSPGPRACFDITYMNRSGLAHRRTQ